ncbi:MAG TPA: hypothetical protein VIF09_12655 [Polyangiaceae bacterium]
MKAASFLVLVAALLAGTGCNEEKQQECGKFVLAIKPLDQGNPSSAAVDSVAKQVAGMAFKDQTLTIYAKNYGERLKVLSNALTLQESPNAPDGTNDLVKKTLGLARTDADDVRRYCAP